MNAEEKLVYSERWRCSYGDVTEANEVELSIAGYHFFGVSWQHTEFKADGTVVHVEGRRNIALRANSGYHRCVMLEMINHWNSDHRWKYRLCN